MLLKYIQIYKDITGKPSLYCSFFLFQMKNVFANLYSGKSTISKDANEIKI